MIRGNVSVTANCSPSTRHPDARITLHFGDLASAALTIEQLDSLADQLQRARADVVSLVPSLHPVAEPVPSATVAALIGSRCASCGETIRLGAPVHVYGEEMVHVGPCPGEEVGRG